MSLKNVLMSRFPECLLFHGTDISLNVIANSFTENKQIIFAQLGPTGILTTRTVAHVTLLHASPKIDLLLVRLGPAC